jgi:hypothetical protein
MNPVETSSFQAAECLSAVPPLFTGEPFTSQSFKFVNLLQKLWYAFRETYFSNLHKGAIWVIGGLGSTPKHIINQ